MNLIDFGKLIAALRREHEDEQGVPWTQEKLAEEMNLAAGAELFSRQIIGSVERGRRRLDKQTLLALADALELTSGERKEFFMAASGIDSYVVARQDKVPEDVLCELTERMVRTQLPAFIMDAYCDLVAINGAMVELFDFAFTGLGPGTTQAELPFPYNITRLVFSDESEAQFRKVMGDGWPVYASEVMRFFRASTLQQRSTLYFQDLLRAMNKCRFFRRYWREVYFEVEDYSTIGGEVYFDSQRWGPISSYFAVFTALTPAAELHLCVFVPLDVVTAKIFCKITQQYPDTKAYRVESWPDKAGPGANRMRSV